MNNTKNLLAALLTINLVVLPISTVFANEEEAVEEVTKEERQSVEKELPKIYTGNAFIDTISETSMKLGADYGIYASVMIAQAVLESNYGKSALSQSPSYNLFGIKGKYKGQGSIFKTAEDDGSGNLFTIKSKFRQYPSLNNSLEDYANLIKYGLKSSSSYYSGAWKDNTENYADATSYLQGRYATDTNYAKKLNHLINKFDLTRFDVDSYARYEVDEVITVVEGDTLRKLAKTYKTTVEELIAWNKLESDQINVGQQLIVSIKKIAAVPTEQTTVNTEQTGKVTEQQQAEEVVEETKKVVVKAKKPETIVKEIKEVKKKKVQLEKMPTKKVKKKKEVIYEATKYYTVVQGDSITSIAAIHHITTDELKKWNKLKNASLNAGQKLIVDVKGSKKSTSNQVKQPMRYVIQPGDSLASIATKFKMTEQELIKINHLDSVFVYDGQILKIKE